MLKIEKHNKCFTEEIYMISGYRITCSRAGVSYVGIQDNPYGDNLVLFNDKDGSTLAIPVSDFSLDSIYKKISKTR